MKSSKMAPDRDAIAPALDSIAVAGADAVNVLTSSILYFARASITERMAAARLPAIYQWPEYPPERALIAYGPRQSLISRLLAEQIDRLLRGIPVAAVPVIQPSKYDLVINAQTARKLGLTILPSLKGIKASDAPRAQRTTFRRGGP